jgi:hypothetical protein
VFAHPDKTQTLILALGLGRYSRVAVFLCCIYIAGLILYGFSATLTGFFSILLTQLFFRIWPPKRLNEQPAKSTIWRRVAAEFLGTLTPQLTGPSLPAIASYDVEWGDFYNVLQDYLFKGAPVLANEALLFFTYLQAAGWALMYLYWRTAIHGHWSVLLVSVTIILSAASFPFVANFSYWKYDRLTAWDFTARLINEIKMREKSVSSSQQQP